MPLLDPAAIDQAMRDPTRSVPALRRLGGGSLLATPAGDPWRVVGRASVIYALRRPTGRILALRVPLETEPPLLARLGDRYLSLGTDPRLAPLRGGPLPAEIRWQPDGLLLPAPGFRTLSHPVIALEHLTGGTLEQAATSATAAADRPRLAALARAFAAAMTAAAPVGFGHGDLRPANVMLRRPDEAVLVDLDTAAWPASPGTPRDADPAVRDRVPALLLLTELLALAWDPSLLAAAIGTPISRLLIGSADLANPADSLLFARLREADDPALRRAAEFVVATAGCPAGDLPPFDQIVAAIGLAGEAVGAAAPAVGGPAAVAGEDRGALSAPGEQRAPTASAWASPAFDSGHPPDTGGPGPTASVAGGRQLGSGQGTDGSVLSSRPDPPRLAGPQPPAGAMSPTPRPAAASAQPARPTPASTSGPPGPHPPPPPQQAGVADGSPPRSPPDDAETAAVASAIGARGPTSGAPPIATGTLSPAERQQAITRLNALLLTGEAAAAERFWVASGLDRDPDAVRELGPLLRALGLAGGSAVDVGGATPAADVPGMGTVDEPAPATLPQPGPEVAAAEAAFDAVRRALEVGDVGPVVEHWPVARGSPRAGFLAARVAGLLARDAVNRARRYQRMGDDAALARLPAEVAGLGIALPDEVRRAARAAATREQIRHRLLAAWRARDRAALTAAALAGDTAAVAPLPAALAAAVERALAWPRLERGLAADDDVAILDAWDPALFEEDPWLPPEARQRAHLARRRIAWLHAVRAAVRQRDGAALRAAVAAMPAGAERRLSATERRRIERLVRAEEARERLSAALRGGSDIAILDALAALEAAGGRLPEGIGWDALRGVVDRVTLTRALWEAATAEPPDVDRLLALLPAARALLRDAHGAAGPALDLPALERQALRVVHLARVREALATGDDRAIVAAAHPDPFGALALLNQGERERIAAAVAVAARTRIPSS